MASHIGRRKFLATLGGAAVAWPLAARAQQPTPIVGLINVMTAHRLKCSHPFSALPNNSANYSRQMR
jgi:hypothetical protein